MGSVQHYEKLFKRKNEGKYRAILLSLIVGYVLLANIFYFLVYLTSFHIGIMVFLAALLGYIIFFSLKFMRVEYEYSIYDGQFSFARIYGKSVRRTIFDVELSSVTDLLPYNENDLSQFTKKHHEIISGVYSSSAKDVWFFVMKDGSDKNIIFLFEMDEELRKTIKHYNPKLLYKSNIAK